MFRKRVNKMEKKMFEGASATDKLQVLTAQLKRLCFQEKSPVRGEATIIVRNAKNLEILRKQRIPNIVTNGGLGIFAQATASPFTTYLGQRYYWYLVLGTGSGTPSAGDTGLFTPVAASAKHGSISQTGAQYQYYVRYMPEDANGYTYTEAGIYDKVPISAEGPGAYTTGTLLNHLMLSPTLAKDATILVDFYITVTFS
jgi:hypothetical protein